MSEAVGASAKISAKALVPWIAAVLVLPAIALATYGSIYSRVGVIDAFMYSGLIENYDDVVDRIGPTYYAARVAHIFPAMLFDKAFGTFWGFYLFRYMWLAAASLAAFEFARKMYSAPIGLVAAALVACSPWFLLAFNDDLYDGTAAIYLLLGYTFAFIPTRRPVAAHFIAGAAVALATQTVQLTIGVFIFAFPGWLLINYSRGWKTSLLLLAGAAAGFFLTYLSLTALLPLANPRWAEGDPTFGIILQLLQGGASAWKATFAGIFKEEFYYAFAPALIALGLIGTAAMRASKQSPNRLALIAYASIVALPLAFYVWRTLEQHAVLANNFTIVFLYPASVVAGGVLLGESLRGATRKTEIVVCLSATAGMILLWSAMTIDLVKILDDFFQWPMFLAVGLILVAALTAARIGGASGLAPVAAAAILLFVAAAPYQDREAQNTRLAQSTGWDVRQGIGRLMKVVSTRFPPKGEPVGFWYENTPALNSLQSAYLWGYTRVFGTESTGLPMIDATTAKTMAGIPRLVLLAESAAKLDEGIDAFQQYAAYTSGGSALLERGEYKGKTWGYHYALINRQDAKLPEAAPSKATLAFLDLATMKAQSPSSSVAMNNGRITLTSPPGVGVGAVIDLPPATRKNTPGVVRVWSHLTSGEMSVSASAPSEAATIRHPAVTLPAGEKITLLYLKNLAEPTSVVFANASGAVASIAEISAIEVASAEGEVPVAISNHTPLNDQLRQELLGGTVKGCLSNFKITSVDVLPYVSIRERKASPQMQVIEIDAVVRVGGKDKSTLLTVVYEEQGGKWPITSISSSYCDDAAN